MKAFAELKWSLQTIGAEFEQAKTRASALAMQFKQSQAVTAQFKTQLDQAKLSAQQMKGEVTPEVYRAMQAEVKRLSAAFRESQSQTKSIGANFDVAKRQAAGLKAALNEQGAAAQRIRASLTAAGYSTRNLAQDQIKLKTELQNTAKAMEQAARAQLQMQERAARIGELTNRRDVARDSFFNAYGNLRSAVSVVQTMSAPLVDAIHTAANFEAAMSKVKAITGSDNESMKSLTETARNLGSTTQFTATQAAEAMSYLGMAGWKAAEITEGLPHVLNLAAAGGVDLARAADIVSDDLTAFGLKASDTQRIVDVFAYTISNTNTNVEMMGETMKFAAPVAKAYGATLEETAALTGLMANAGIKASQAGTALRAGFLRLAGPPKKASKEFEELGIDLSDVSRQAAEVQATLSAYGIELNENLPPQQKMVEVIKQLSANTQGLSNEQRLAALSAIFGTNAASGWLNVLDAGPEKLAELVAAIENSKGAAKRMKDTMTDNAKGALKQYDSAMESLSITIGNQFLPIIADAAKIAADVAKDFSEWASEHETLVQWAVLAAGAISGIALAAFGVATAVSGYTFVVAQFTLLSNSIRIVEAAQWAWNAAMSANPIVLMILAIAALVAAGVYLYKNWEKVKAFMANLWDSPAAAVIAFISGPIGWIIYAAAGLISHWEEVKAWFTLLWNDPSAALEVFVNMVKNKFASMYQYVKEKWEKLKYVLSNPITAAVNFVEHGNVYGSMVHASTGISADEIRGLASGGFVNHPQLTWLAEGGYPEAVIPLDGTARAMELWQQAGASLGVHPVASGAVEASTIEAPIIRSGGGDVNIEFSAPITINGNADNRTVDQIADAAQQMKRQFEDMFRDMMAQQRRVSLA